MEWLWIILRYLFPLDPVRQCIAVLCDRVAVMINMALDDDVLDELAGDADARIAIEMVLIDYESTLRLVIAARAHQIARLRFLPGMKDFHRPTRARSLVALVKRIQILAKDCADIERLAQLQAIRLKRKRAADPLGLAAHGSTDAALRAAAHHEAVGVSCADLSSTGEAGGGGSPRLRGETEGAGRNAAGARAPPVFHAFPNPTPRLAGVTCEAATRYPTPICPNRGSLPPWPRARISSNSSPAAAWRAQASRACSTASSPTTSTR